MSNRLLFADYSASFQNKQLKSAKLSVKGIREFQV